MRYLFIFCCSFFLSLSAVADYQLTPKKIAENTWLVEGSTDNFSLHNGGNIVNAAFIVTDSGVLVVDTGPSFAYGKVLRAAIASGEQAAISDELGDLLFATVNVARHLKVNPETALRAANIKFSERLQCVEQQAQAQGMTLSDCTEVQLDALWNVAKQALSKSQ